MLKRLRKAKYDSNISTNGIEIIEWVSGKKGEQVKFLAYDFGGKQKLKQKIKIK